MHTLKNFFGTDRIAFSAFSNKSCTTRSFDRFSDALEEVIDARVWAGIHFRTADEQGAKLGKKVAHYLKKHYFQPVRLTPMTPHAVRPQMPPEARLVATLHQTWRLLFCTESELALK